MKKFRTLRRTLLPLLFVLAILTGCSQSESETDYSKPENWAYIDTGTVGRDADVFFICPSVYSGSGDDGRPIILAGFSQGADMCLRLMKDFFGQDGRMDQLIACYAIG